MSDTWYRDAPEPYEMSDGSLWTVDGRCVKPAPAPAPTFLDDWPDELRSVAFKAAVNMDLLDSYFAEVILGEPAENAKAAGFGPAPDSVEVTYTRYDD